MISCEPSSDVAILRLRKQITKTTAKEILILKITGPFTHSTKLCYKSTILKDLLCYGKGPMKASYLKKIGISSQISDPKRHVLKDGRTLYSAPPNQMINLRSIDNE